MLEPLPSSTDALSTFILKQPGFGGRGGGAPFGGEWGMSGKYQRASVLKVKDENFRRQKVRLIY